jgi:hypothetical protein
MARAQAAIAGAKTTSATVHGEVERLLEAQRRAQEAGPGHGQERHALHLVDLEAGAHDVRPAGNEVDVDPELG